MKLVPIKGPRPVPLSIRYDERRPRILYIEDEDVNWEVAESELEPRFNIDWARNARDAFWRISESVYHMILMDIQLSRSDLNGLEIARILKRRPIRTIIPEYAKGIEALDTPIVFVTAYTARYSREDILDAGGEDLLSKPVNFQLLSLILARVWGRGKAPSMPPSFR
jgi:two-component system sensor histidine kinase BarA